MHTYFDAHCDTMSKMYKKRIGLDSADLMVNTNNLKAYKSAVQVFALFNNGEVKKQDMLSCFDFFKNECKKLSSLVSVCTSGSEIEKNKAPLSAVLAIEGAGNQPDFSPDDVSDFYNIGVRFMSLCWNNNNTLCSGCEGDDTGLTDLGIQTLLQMEKHRIILDVSHMSDKSFRESFEHYSLPICATHSVSRFVHKHVRNLTDEQFLAIVKRRGVCGINFYPPFLCSGEAKLDTVIKHIEHFMALGGEDCLGLGSDFDGIGTTPENLENSSQICNLLDRLLAMNYTQEQVEKIAFGNFKRLFAQFTA